MDVVSDEDFEKEQELVKSINIQYHEDYEKLVARLKKYNHIPYIKQIDEKRSLMKCQIVYKHMERSVEFSTDEKEYNVRIGYAKLQALLDVLALLKEAMLRDMGLIE